MLQPCGDFEMATDDQHKRTILRWPPASPELRAYCALVGAAPLMNGTPVPVRSPDEAISTARER